MKIRRTTVCHTCRSRKLACDGKRPACSQCVLRGHKCAGYQHDLIFVSHGPAGNGISKPLRHSQRILHPATERDAISGGSDISESLLPKRAPQLTWDVVLHVLAREYSPDLTLFSSPHISYAPRDCVCGMWVDRLFELPRSAAQEPVVMAALTALGATIMSRGSRKNVSQDARFDLHVSALQLLAKGLQASKRPLAPEFGIAIMCLTMTELLSPTFSTAWMMHGSGAAELLRMSGPDHFVSGLNHTVFLACRSMLIYQAILSRKSVFVAYGKWQTVPFSVHPPSEMHQLLGVIAPVTALLERLDVVKATSSDIDIPAARDLRERFIVVFAALEKWTQDFHVRHSRAAPLYWQHRQHGATSPAMSSGDDEGDIWFPTILTATALTDIWSFRIIILISLLTLDTLISSCDISSQYTAVNVPVVRGSNPTNESNSTELLDRDFLSISSSSSVCPLSNPLASRANILRMAQRIRQSVSYHLQPGAAFYGLSAAGFLIKMALDAYQFLANETEELTAAQQQQEQQKKQRQQASEGIKQCQSAIRELEVRGYPYAALFNGRY